MAENKIGYLPIDAMRSVPSISAVVGSEMLEPTLISNGRKGELADRVRIPHTLPHKGALQYSADAEDRYTEETGGGSFGKLYPEYNGIQSDRTFPIEAARLKAEAILRYYMQHPDSHHGIPDVFMTQDIAASIFAAGEWYVLHKPVTQRDREMQTELLKIAAETNGVFAYHAGITVAHLNTQSISKMYGVETTLGPIRKDFNPDEIIGIQKDHPKVTGGIDVTQVLGELVVPGSAISVVQKQFDPGKAGWMVSGSILLPERTDHSSMTNSPDILGKISGINHGFFLK